MDPNGVYFIMAAVNYRDRQDDRVVFFAWNMRRIPRKAVRCEVYGTVSAAVDERHARNIFAKVAPAASADALSEALSVLQHRLDETAATPS